MADLSGVLRKTIDGLPRATPQMRAKVYEKARAAIERQVRASDPPLDNAVVEARLAAIEDAIERTERHYQAADAGSDAAGASAPVADKHVEPAPQPSSTPEDSASNAAADAPEAPVQRSASPQTPPSKRTEPAFTSAEATAPHVASPEGSDARSTWSQQAEAAPVSMPDTPEAGGKKPVFPGFSRDPAASRAPSAGTTSAQGLTAGPTDPADQPFFPLTDEQPTGDAAPASVGAPFVVPESKGASDRVKTADRDTDDEGDRFDDDRLPAGLRSGDDFIPEADVSAPRYSQPRRKKPGARGNAAKVLVGCLAVLVLGGIGTAGWLYRDDIQALLVAPEGLDTIARNAASPDADPSDANPADTALPDGDEPSDTASNDTPTLGNESPSAVEETAEAQDTSEPAETEVASGEDATGSTREFTQRLLPNGTEVDEGPAEPQPNAFDEGTNIATASPIENGDVVDDGSATISSEIGTNPETVGGSEAPASTSSNTNTEVAAIDPAEKSGVPAVAQKALFYQERTETASGTQESGNVVWTVVNEPPSDGSPAEPAIRAKVDIPDENMTMTMTIRRNADPTLPASHVIEILFNTPGDFSGGGIANVQRPALKSTEQARGQPLIGVAGKISDGFFIVALNNLDEATQSNLTLLREQQWIDIPVAYATGRRALLSIEKGIPGDEAFKEAIEAWNAKT